MGAKMLKFPIPERQETNFEFTMKVFVGSKIWYLNKFYLFLFSKDLGCYKQGGYESKRGCKTWLAFNLSLTVPSWPLYIGGQVSRIG
jgi:hypothetical protein